MTSDQGPGASKLFKGPLSPVPCPWSLLLKHPLMLMILDGWGHRETRDYNAIALARTPHYDSLLAKFPHTLLDSSGHAVGLPEGLMGNSEVGHLNIGAGRIVYVGLTRIFSAIEDGSFFSNPSLVKAMSVAAKNNSTLHLMGLVSDGGVHSHEDHLYALLEMACRQGVKSVAVHAFTDGRDTPPTSGVEYLRKLERKIQGIGVGKLATVTGRFFAMDRDLRWERTLQAYEAMIHGTGIHARCFEAAVLEAYRRGETDEFLKPIVLVDPSDRPIATIQDGDAVIFFNFRADRARQITWALTDPKLEGPARKFFPKLASFVGLGEYDKKFPLPVAFPPVHLKHIFPGELARHGLTQLRIAETEKYAHVTFFFNGGEEAVFPGEERILIPSPREVATYDLKPEMSAPQLGEEVLRQLEKDKFDVIILNFANADMVGHTGNLQAAIQAVQTIDEQLGKIEKAILHRGGTLLITADHGNCEQMSDDRGDPHTAHTTDLVPFLLVGKDFQSRKLRSGGTLADIAPTMLEILKLPQPEEMTGRSLLIP